MPQTRAQADQKLHPAISTANLEPRRHSENRTTRPELSVDDPRKQFRNHNLTKWSRG